jgi:hypothetical protein
MFVGPPPTSPGAAAITALVLLSLLGLHNGSTASAITPPPNTSLDRSAGRVFFNLFGAAKVVANRRARSSLTLGNVKETS